MKGVKPIVHVIAGANGSGKSTFAQEYLLQMQRYPSFINADLIALGLSPYNPEAVKVTAGKLVLQRIQGFLKKRESFGFETTLSGTAYRRLLKILGARGFEVRLCYLWVRQVKLAIKRIKDRVKRGGHDVPEPDVRRRYLRSLRNFHSYARLADRVLVFDNSGYPPRLVAKGERGNLRPVEPKLFAQFIDQVRKNQHENPRK